MDRRVEAQQDLLPLRPGPPWRTLAPYVRPTVGHPSTRRTLAPDVRSAVGPRPSRPRRPAGSGRRDLGGHE